MKITDTFKRFSAVEYSPIRYHIVRESSQTIVGFCAIMEKEFKWRKGIVKPKEVRFTPSEGTDFTVQELLLIMTLVATLNEKHGFEYSY